MSAPTELTKNTTESGAESPTTVRPLDMDDDDVQETALENEASTTDAPPPKPPRPLTEAQKNELILKEAFPSVDNNVIKAVLRASGGRVEPAFNALLEMTDPDAAKNNVEDDDAPPPQPPRPQNRAQMSQVEADELYARQLAEHYDNVGAYESRTSNRNFNGGRTRQEPGHGEEPEYSFIDDDLPVIRENLRKGFMETQTKVNGWITNLKKKIEENFDESEEGQAQQQHGEPFRRPGESSRRSGDYHRYDADPEVLSDDFAGMKFAADGTPINNRPMANTGMFKPPPPSTSPRPSSNGRRVGFKEETEEINMYESSPRVPPKDTVPAGGAKASKWQPLSTVDPSPITDNDPFSLGDSEDEKETKEKPKDTKSEESERLKKAAAEAMADSLVDSADSSKKN